MEIIELTENQFDCIVGDERVCYEGSEDWLNPEYKLISRECKYTNLSKGYSLMDIVIERMCDNTFWKGEYTEGDCEKYFDDLTFKRVYKKQFVTTLTIYE